MTVCPSSSMRTPASARCLIWLRSSQSHHCSVRACQGGRESNPSCEPPRTLDHASLMSRAFCVALDVARAAAHENRRPFAVCRRAPAHDLGERAIAAEADIVLVETTISHARARHVAQDSLIVGHYSLLHIMACRSRFGLYARNGMPLNRHAQSRSSRRYNGCTPRTHDAACAAQRMA
jgi:hypothetical protein